MAYNKHVWVARQGVGLNKFIDQNGNRYEFTPSPDEVTQPGTPFSAEWMNEMEEQLAKAAVLDGEAVEGNFPAFNALGELINSGKGPDILQYVNGAFSTLDGTSVDVGSAKVETGSFVGTETPPTLTFSFAPKMVIITANGTISNYPSSSNWKNNCIYNGHDKYSMAAALFASGQSMIHGKGSPLLLSSTSSSYVMFVCLPLSYNSVTFSGNTVTWAHSTNICGTAVVTAGQTPSVQGRTVSSTEYVEHYNFYRCCYNTTYHYMAIG